MPLSHQIFFVAFWLIKKKKALPYNVLQFAAWTNTLYLIAFCTVRELLDFFFFILLAYDTNERILLLAFN